MRSVFIAVLGIFAFGQGAASAQTTATYKCSDGSEFVAAIFDGERAMRIQLDGKAVKLNKRVAASGQRYSAGDITLRVSKTGATTLKRGKRTVECSR